MHTAQAVHPNSTATPTIRRRETWIDTAKGMAILLIVFTHSGLVLGINEAPRPTWWGPVDHALTMVRLPAFFLISGLFMRNTIKRSRQEFLSSKVAPMAWLYLLWSFAWAITMGVYANGSHSALTEWVRSTLTITNGTWYLAALPLYYLGWRATRDWSGWVLWPLAGATALVFGANWLTTGSWGLNRILMYALFFLIGAHLPDKVRILVSRTPAWLAVVAVPALYLALQIKMPAAWLNDVRVALFPLAAVPVFLVLARMIDNGRLAQGLRWLGARTLPIYVMHMFALDLVVRLLLPTADLLPFSIVGVMPLLMTILATSLTLATWAATRGVPGLYSAPTWLRELGKPVKPLAA